MGSPILILTMLTFLLLPLLASHSSAQYAGCPETYGVQVYPHEQYCDKFYKCVNGTLTEEICENGLVFDGYGDIHNHCNYNWAVDCGKRVYDDTPISPRIHYCGDNSVFDSQSLTCIYYEDKHLQPQFATGGFG